MDEEIRKRYRMARRLKQIVDDYFEWCDGTDEEVSTAETLYGMLDAVVYLYGSRKDG